MKNFKIAILVTLFISLLSACSISSSGVTVLVDKQEKSMSKTVFQELTKERNEIKGEFPSGEPEISFIHENIEYQIFHVDNNYLMLVISEETNLYELTEEFVKELKADLNQ